MSEAIRWERVIIRGITHAAGLDVHLAEVLVATPIIECKHTEDGGRS